MEASAASDLQPSSCRRHFEAPGKGIGTRGASHPFCLGRRTSCSSLHCRQSRCLARRSRPVKISCPTLADSQLFCLAPQFWPHGRAVSQIGKGSCAATIPCQFWVGSRICPSQTCFSRVRSWSPDSTPCSSFGSSSSQIGLPKKIVTIQISEFSHLRRKPTNDRTN